MGYFSRNMNKDDLATVKSFLQHMKIDILNTRAFKKTDTHYIISVGSVFG
jgi:hypothetical protein